jgi:uncharacterized protein YrzB (UPF0473 family)
VKQKTKKRGIEMSEFNENDNIIEEETPVLHLELEDGTEQDCAVIALFSVEDLESDDEEGALLLYRYNEDPEDPDTFSLDNIETDEEYEIVTSILDEILEDE